MKLSGKVAIVTGAGKGIGRAIALAVAEEGAKVVVNALHPESAVSVANEIKSFGEAIAIPADVTKSGEVKGMVRKTLDQFKGLHILVNNVGGSARAEASLFKDSEEKIWNRMIDLNLKSVLVCTRAVIKHMLNRKSGKIINIASEAGLVGDWGLVDYSAAKAGVIGFTRALAKEVAPYGITVNAICPGQVATRILEIKNSFYERAIERLYNSIPMGRRGKPKEVASAVVFLASDDSNFITGQAICVDGGKSIGKF